MQGASSFDPGHADASSPAAPNGTIGPTAKSG